MAEMNAKFYDAILMSNAKIDSFFGQGATQIAGQLNGALGGAAAKFNLSQPGDVEIEEATLTAISAAFGTTEIANLHDDLGMLHFVQHLLEIDPGRRRNCNR